MDGGRSGQLDETRWNVSRIGSSNPNQDEFDWYPSTMLEACDASTVTADGDLLVCGGKLAEGVTNALMAMRIRQKFDISGATSAAPATIVFDVDAQTAADQIDIWFTDEALPFVPDSFGQSVTTPPKNGVGFLLDACPMEPNMTQLSSVYVSTHGSIETLPIQSVADSSGCFSTLRGQPNHIEIAFQPSEIDFGASPVGAGGKPGTFQQFSLVALKAPLPLQLGYVIFEDIPINATSSHVWDNIGFDGVLHALPHAADAPDALVKNGPADGINLGYDIPLTSGVTIPFEVADLSGAASAHLDMDVWAFDNTRTLQYCFNPGPGAVCHTLPSPLAPGGPYDSPLVIPIALSDLHAGVTSISMAITSQTTMFTTVVSNVTLTAEVEP
jgi:hypothetical protein